MKETVREEEILKKIKSNDEISRLELSEFFNLTPARISKIIKKLLEKEVIVERSSNASTGGRPPVILSLNSKKFGNILGINLKPNREIFISVGSIDGVISKKKKQSISNNETEVLEVLEKIITRELSMTENIKVISVVITGVVDSENGKTIMSPHYSWRIKNIGTYLEKKFKLPVLIENDVRAMAYTESMIGSCKNTKNFIIFNLCEAIGTSSFVDGKSYRGHNSMAGEIGHIVINTSSIRKCSCGKRGCLEAEASEKAIIKRLVSEIKTGKYSILKDILNEKGEITIKDVIFGVKKKDFLVIQAVTQAVEYIAQGLNIIISLLDPEKIILVGELFESKFIMDTLKFELNKISLEIQKCEINETKLGDDLFYFSPISVVVENIFENRNFTEKYIHD